MPFNVLVLGGTQMLGRDFVEVLRNLPDYKITLANRGLTNPSLFPNICRLSIDRNDPDKCESLLGQKYDYAVDFSCYNINQFNNTFSYLQYHRYILISTQSVLDTNVLEQKNKSDPYYHYCFHKKELEDHIINNEDIKNITIVRPCAVYGDHDYTNRFERRGDDFFWKYTNNAKVSKETGCVSVSDVTKSLINILVTPINQEQRIHIHNVG
jgi:nucleoside-diphosphate-sugar epimerase